MPLFDTHSHIYLCEKKSETQVIQAIIDTPELIYIASIGVDLKTSHHNIELAKKHNCIIPTIGIHPCHVEEYKDKLQESIGELEKIIQEEKVYAIGECGLDYYRLPPRLTETSLNAEDIKSLQSIFFKQQIDLAKKHHLPIIIHSREAGNEVFEILKEKDCTNFVFHCYSENLEFAQQLLTFAPNCMIGFSGIVTFQNAQSLQEVAKNIPLKNIMIETDCPFLSPVPERGTENYPTKVKYVLQKIQSLRLENQDEIEQTIFENSLRFYGMKS